MDHDLITDPNLEPAPDTQLDDFSAIGDVQIDELISDVNALINDMPELSASTGAADVLSQRRRDRAAEKEAKLQKNARRFYRGYFIGVAVLFCALLILMIPLRNWLARFESTQPDQYSQYIYETVFAQPDWAAIYDRSETADSGFDGRDAYVSYMQSKIDAAQNKQLFCYETSAGLSKDHKYIVELDGERIATFMLTGTVNPKTEKTEWEMVDLQLVIDRNYSVLIQREPGQSVLINGKPVSDDYVVRNIQTKAEAYLPEGVQGFRLQELYVDGLMAAPAVAIVDAQGNTVPTIYDADRNCYAPDLSATNSMTDTEKDLLLNAAKANALFAIRAIGTGELSKYFDSSTQIYKDICDTPTFIQSFASYSFNESVTAISEFYRYNDDLFSARVTLQLNITRKNGTVKSLDMNTTYFFTKNASGKYMVTDITNVSVQERTEQVRLRFDCDGIIVNTVFVNADAQSVQIPQPTVPAGQTFLGWATQSVADDGQITMDILFEPSENGLAQIPADLTLEPMTLYAVFKTEEAGQE